MIDTEDGNMASSSISVKIVSSGTSTIPPPVPNNPLTAPAQAPVMMILSFDFIKNILLREVFPQEDALCIKRGVCTEIVSTDMRGVCGKSPTVRLYLVW